MTKEAGIETSQTYKKNSTRSGNGKRKSDKHQKHNRSSQGDNSSGTSKGSSAVHTHKNLYKMPELDVQQKLDSMITFNSDSLTSRMFPDHKIDSPSTVDEVYYRQAAEYLKKMKQAGPGRLTFEQFITHGVNFKESRQFDDDQDD